MPPMQGQVPNMNPPTYPPVYPQSNSPPPINSTSRMKVKELEISQKGKNYIIELSRSTNGLFITIKEASKVDSIYEIEISLEYLHSKNQIFRMYKSLDDFINAFETFIQNNNLKLIDNYNQIILDFYVFNIMNGKKEKIEFELNRLGNINKDEIIKALSLKVNLLEETFQNLNEKCNMLEEKFEKINMYVPMTKQEVKKFSFEWEEHENCELSNNNKVSKKTKSEGWNTVVKGNKVLVDKIINVFKIKINSIDEDKTGLAIGISKADATGVTISNNWTINCGHTCQYNPHFKNFKNEVLNKDDILTFIVDLYNGKLKVKKNEDLLGTATDLPKGEDMVPCVCNYYPGNEVEIIE